MQLGSGITSVQLLVMISSANLLGRTQSLLPDTKTSQEMLKTWDQPGHWTQCGWKSDQGDRRICLMSPFYNRSCQYPVQQATERRYAGIDWYLQGVRRSLIMVLMRTEPARHLWMVIAASNNPLLVVQAEQIFSTALWKVTKTFSTGKKENGKPMPF